MVVLDATAGNRMMWGGKKAPGIIYMDRELKLARPPDIFADHCSCPFRDNVFENVIFDPPHAWGTPPWWTDPSMSKHKDKKKGPQSWYGDYKNRRDMIVSIVKAQKEFARISTRLSFKWCEIKIGLWRILSCFTEWTVINKNEWYSNRNVKQAQKTYWVLLIRTSR